MPGTAGSPCHTGMAEPCQAALSSETFADNTSNVQLPHQPSDCAAGHVKAFAAHLVVSH